MNRRRFLQVGSIAAVAASTIKAEPETSAKGATTSTPLIHPGVLQGREDLERMKALVISGAEPVAAAWKRLLQHPTASLNFQPHPHAHVYRGAGGIAKSGADEFSAAGQAAHFHALQWIVTNDSRHAEKVAEILDAWSQVLWDFSGNDAKLIAGWVTGYLCNAAEILQATYPGWSTASRRKFRTMLSEVFVPLLRPFFPEANGNWDGAIMFSLAAIAVHLDHRSLFDEVVNHYLLGTGNGGILKYVWPSGQCEETTRDQGHVQLGLGYFSYAAHVLSMQGVDAFAAGGNRLALGFEYTSTYMLGESVPYFGDISDRLRGHFNDYYEATLAHFTEKGFALPYTGRAAERARENGAVSTVWFYRGKSGSNVLRQLPKPSPVARAAGASGSAAEPLGEDWIRVAAGTSIEQTLARKTNGDKKIFLLPGQHEISGPLLLTSGLMIQGSGRATILHCSSSSGEFCIHQGQSELRGVVLKNFVIEGAQSVVWPLDPNEEKRHRSSPLAAQRGGILLQGNREFEIQDIRLEQLTIRNCTMSGLSIAGAARIVIVDCDISGNGGSGAPGPGLHHNISLTHVNDCRISGSRLAGSMWGSGVAAVHSSNIRILNVEAARNRRFGAEFLNCGATEISASLLEANDAGAYSSNEIGSAGSVKTHNLLETLNGHPA